MKYILLAVMIHNNGTPPDVFKVDMGLTYTECLEAHEGLSPIMLPNVYLTCEKE